MKNYEYHSGERLEMIAMRANRCVCKYCGKKLHLQRIMFQDIKEARSEIYCKNCEKIEFGVEPEIYQCAVSFVDQCGYDHFPDLDDNERKRQMNIAKTCEIMDWCCKELGILTQDGFKRELNVSADKAKGLLIVPSSAISDEAQEMR